MMRYNMLPALQLKKPFCEPARTTYCMMRTGFDRMIKLYDHDS